MALLFLYYGMVVTGYYIGSKCRSIKDRLWWTGKLLLAAVSALVFFMGVRMGSNKDVISNLGTIGLEALFMTVVIMAGSILAVTGARKLLRIDKYGQPKNTGCKIHANAADEDGSIKTLAETTAPAPKNTGLSMTVAILLFVAAGILFGYFLIPKLFSDIRVFIAISEKILVIGLCFLLFFVGIDLGLSGSITSNIKAVGAKVLVFPVAAVLGSLAASFLCCFILPVSGKEALAIGAGFGWYTFAPVVITKQGYIVAGAISFMHNVMRELGGVVLMPVVAQKIGYIEATSMPGVAAMDMFIPIVERICGEKIVIYSFLIGLFQSAMASVLVPLFIGL
jgi:uncharacterized membrane protein YbjE (DUF340 family)